MNWKGFGNTGRSRFMPGLCSCKSRTNQNRGKWTQNSHL